MRAQRTTWIVGVYTRDTGWLIREHKIRRVCPLKACFEGIRRTSGAPWTLEAGIRGRAGALRQG